MSFLLLLLAAPQAEVCAPCHRAEATAQVKTPMSRALESVRDCGILKANRDLKFRRAGYSYHIRREGDRSLYTVTDGKNTLTVPLVWAFGLGAAGQTYVFEYDESLYESRVSFYNAINGLDLTMGAANEAPSNIRDAAGRKMDANDARDCFHCHATSAVRERALALDTLIPGVQCDRCHGSSSRHVSARAAMPKLSSLSTEEVSDLCGGCHRTWAQVAASGMKGVLSVRFQPYRLTNSKCYDAADRRIACTSCHDPHTHTVRDAVFYDAKCAACHSAAIARARICRVAARDCVSCHMPKVELPGAHFAFTDHQIRISKKGEPFPN
jgi:hypothetical protein